MQVLMHESSVVEIHVRINVTRWYYIVWGKVCNIHTDKTTKARKPN